MSPFLSQFLYIFNKKNSSRKTLDTREKMLYAALRGGAQWALEHWYVTLRPKWVISKPNGPKIIQFDNKSDHISS